MSRAISREFLEADLAALTSLIEETPQTYVFERIGLESRRAEVQAELAALRICAGTNAEVVISFSGDPVVGSLGIESTFAADAVGAFQKFVSTVLAQRNRGELAATGPLPAESDSRLHLTNIVHGSFGFELRELEPWLLGSSELAESVEGALEMLQGAKDGEDHFAELIEKNGERVRAAAAAFLDVLLARNAAVSLRSDRRSVDLSGSHMPAIFAVVHDARVEDVEENLRGSFGGAYIVARTFEMKIDGEIVVHGKIDERLDPLEINRWTGRRCAARLRIMRTYVGNIEKRARYTLISIGPENVESTPPRVT